MIVAAAMTAWAGVGCGNPRSTVSLYYPNARQETFTKAPHEHYQNVSNIAAHDQKALAEDLDLLFLTDRPSRLTRWHDR